MPFRFAHLADCHLGAWGNHPDFKEFPLRAFARAVDIIISERLDFALIAGDFFDSSMPAVDVLRFATEQLMRLKNEGMPVYAVAGSHDYSPTGKTMLSVLEAAGLLVNVHKKWAQDKTGARIFGVEGLRGGLDREQFSKLFDTNSPSSKAGRADYDTNSPSSKDGRADYDTNSRFPNPAGGSYDTNSPSSKAGRADYNIFMFHAAVDEITGMNGVSISALPKGFDYYATGHVHIPRYQTFEGVPLVFPGPLFPAEFSELEALGVGSFSIASVSDGKTDVSTRQLQIAPVRTIEIKCDGKIPQRIESEFIEAVAMRDVSGMIVLLKASGEIASGKPTDVNWRAISERAQASGALAVKRSVHITTKEENLVKVEASGNIEQIERAIIEKNAGNDIEKVLKIMGVLSVEKAEDEKVANFEERISSGIKKALGVEWK